MISFDEEMMLRALKLAERARGFTAPNPVVGAVIVKDGKIAGEGWHHGAGRPHAEIEAIRSVERTDSLRGATLYVTLEPCSTFGRTPPCTQAILENGFARVVAGCTDPNAKHAGRGFRILKEAGIEVVSGVLEDQCREANHPFFHFITQHRPFVLLKMASTLDGKTATASGDSKWVTSPAARERVQELRTSSEAVMVGSSTFRTDAPALTVRDSSGRVLRTPLRIVASSDPDLVLPEGWEKADLPDKKAWDAFLHSLAEKNVMQLLIEGGGTLAASALRAEAVDRVEFHYAPKILGGAHSRTVADGPDPEKMSDAIAVDDLELRRIGCDFMVSGKPVYSEMREEII